MAGPLREPAATEILSNERLRQALAVRDWLLGEAREIRDPNIILEGLCLKSATPAFRSTAPSAPSSCVTPSARRTPVSGSAAGGRTKMSTPMTGAPIRPADGRWRRRIAAMNGSSPWLADLSDDTYDIVAPLRAAGYTHHIAVPIALPNGMRTASPLRHAPQTASP